MQQRVNQHGGTWLSVLSWSRRSSVVLWLVSQPFDYNRAALDHNTLHTQNMRMNEFFLIAQRWTTLPRFQTKQMCLSGTSPIFHVYGSDVSICMLQTLITGKALQKLLVQNSTPWSSRKRTNVVTATVLSIGMRRFLVQNTQLAVRSLSRLHPRLRGNTTCPVTKKDFLLTLLCYI